VYLGRRADEPDCPEMGAESSRRGLTTRSIFC
jgi:hypothetical protein